MSGNVKRYGTPGVGGSAKAETKVVSASVALCDPKEGSCHPTQDLCNPGRGAVNTGAQPWRTGGLGRPQGKGEAKLSCGKIIIL